MKNKPNLPNIFFFMRQKYCNILYLKPVDEEEVKSKASLDVNNVSMF